MVLRVGLFYSRQLFKKCIQWANVEHLLLQNFLNANTNSYSNNTTKTVSM